MTSAHEPGGFYATNRRNIDELRAERDRAGLLQLITVLTATEGPLAYDAARLIADANDAIAWIADTSPRIVTAADAASMRVGDILEYSIDGRARQAVVLAIVDRIAVTSLGDEVPLQEAP